MVKFCIKIENFLFVESEFSANKTIFHLCLEFYDIYSHIA
jgi:hypothetical protein